MFSLKHNNQNLYLLLPLFQNRFLDSEALDCFYFFKRPYLLEGVRQGDNLRFRGFRLFKKTLSILEGIRQGEYSTSLLFFFFFAHSSKAD